MRRAIVVAGVVVAASIAAAVLGRARFAHPPVHGAAEEAPTFVGRAACGGCHEAQLGAWTGSHHDRAMQVADETTVLGDFGNATLEHFGVPTTFFRRDGKYLVRTDGPDGQLHDYEVAYTFGVYPLQQYLVAFPGGRYQALTVAWDARPKEQGGQRWFDLHPEEPVPASDVLHWTGYLENWNARCAECHSTNLKKGYDVEHDRYATTWSELNVSCEACHGPGSRHAAWAKNRTSDPARGLVVDLGDQGVRWLMDDATGIAHRSSPRSSENEIETCGRCHSRRGVETEDYVWGRPLMDTHRPALLEAPLYFADGQIEDEVYEYASFRLSRMYRMGVTCSSCHDPHSLRLRGVTDDPNAVCAQCHAPATFATPAHHHHAEGSAGARCVACHMPSRLYMVIDARRDHSIRVPRPDLTLKIGTPNACNGCHGDRSAQWASDAVTRWYGNERSSTPHWGETIHAGRHDEPGASTALGRLAIDANEPAFARATAVSLLRTHLDRGGAPALDQAAHDPDPLVRAAVARASADVEPVRRVQLAAPLLTDPVRGVRSDAARALASLRPDALPAERRGDFARALGEYRAAQILNADQPEGRLNLATLAAEHGDAATAEREYQAALRIAPGFPATYVNLADLYRAEARDDEGEALLRRGLTLSPTSADLHHALGLVLVRRGRAGEAVASFARATELDPDNVRYAYVYGVALHSTGRSDAALAVLENAQRRHPGDRDVLAALATMHRDRGDRAQAVEWGRRLVSAAPDDPAAHALLEEIERGQSR